MMDYRFGWRWIIPVESGDPVLMLGFTESEVAFWKNALTDAVVTADPISAKVWVVYNQSPDITFGLDTVQLRTLCVVGSRSINAQWRKWVAGRMAETVEYALLPSDNPRVVIPLGAKIWTEKGLSLHRPGRWIARFAIATSRVFVRMGFNWPLRRRSVLVSTKYAGILPHGARLAGLDAISIGAPGSVAMYLGLPNENRKTVILPLDGVPRIIYKEGKSLKAKAALLNEANALRNLAETPVAMHIPVLVSVLESDQQVTLAQEYRARLPCSAVKINLALVNFVTLLARVDRKKLSFASVLNKIETDVANGGVPSSGRCEVVLNLLQNLAKNDGVDIWGHRSHGDLAPWNCAWSEKGFFVFDWEDSSPWDIAFGDVFYFVVAPAIYVQRSPDPVRVEAQALAMAKRVIDGAGLAIRDIKTYWGLWLLRQHNRHPAILYEKLIERLVASWK